MLTYEYISNSKNVCVNVYIYIYIYTHTLYAYITVSALHNMQQGVWSVFWLKLSSDWSMENLSAHGIWDLLTQNESLRAV